MKEAWEQYYTEKELLIEGRNVFFLFNIPIFFIIDKF